MSNLVLSPVAGLQFVRHGRGMGVRYVASDIRRGKHLSLRPDAYRLLGAFDGVQTIGQIYARHDTAIPSVLPPPAAAGRIIMSLYSAGLLAGDRLPVPAPPAASAPFEAKLVSWRRELVELGPWLPRLDRSLGWMFTRAGAVAWSLLLVVALWMLADHPIDSGDAIAWFTQIDPGEALTLYVVFLVLKGVHELGHAVAYRRFAAAEGVAVNSIRAGLALMFFVPFPYTDVTGAWRLTSRYRRTMVGAAGMYVESWVALAGVVVWAWSGDPVVRAAAGQVAAISGITTILFNLNPLGRMDGYYIFADAIDRPNLARQASHAALTALARATGALPTSRTGSIDVAMLAYWVGAFLFRVTIYTALFWTAAHADAWIAVIALIVAGSLLVGRPLIGALRWLAAVSDRPAQTRHRLIGFAVAVGAGLLIPLPASVVLDGVVERQNLTFVYPAVAARLAPGGSQFSTAEADLKAAENDARHEAAVVQWRQALDEGREDIRSYGDTAQALAVQARQARQDVADLHTGLAGATPLDEDDRRGSTVSLGARPVAVRLPSAGFIIRAVGRESDRAAIEQARTGSARPLGSPVAFRVAIRGVAPQASVELPAPALGRPGGGKIAVLPGDRSGRRAADPLVVVDLAPQGAVPALRHGQRVEVRLDAAPQSLVRRLYHSLALALGTGTRE